MENQSILNKILIFDDDHATLDVIKIVFLEDGYDVLGLSHCNDIYGILKYFKPDIILMDVLLGVIDGRDICKELKSSPYKHIPVVLMSVVTGFYADLKKPLFSEDFIEKPFNIVDLTNKIKKLLPH